MKNNSALRMPLRAGFAALTLLLSTQAFGFNYYSCGSGPHRWETSSPFFRVHSSVMAFEPALDNAIRRWNRVGGSYLYIGYNKVNTNFTPHYGDGVNQIYSEVIGDGDVVARTRVLAYCAGDNGLFAETDVVFDAGRPWTLAPLDHEDPYSSDIRFEAVALHEMGHAVGLDHENGTVAIMNEFYLHGGATGQGAEWDPMPDDRQGLRYLYPSDYYGEVDIAVTRFWKSPTDPRVTILPLPNFITPGDGATIKFTLLNQGTVAQDVPVSVYLVDHAGLGQRTPIRQVYVHNLQPGEARQIDASAAIPRGIWAWPADRYELVVEANYGVHNEYNDKDYGDGIFRRNNFVSRSAPVGAQIYVP